MDLLTYPLNALTRRNNIHPKHIEDVVCGCVTQTGEQGWCVARKAVLAAGWPETVPATTINRVCGSSQQAFNFAAMGVASGAYELVVAGGLEHMTRAPMFSDISGEESPLLQKAYPDLVPQGLAAEALCARYDLSRSELDEYAYQSQARTATAVNQGRFSASLVPVPYQDENGKREVLELDDNPRPDTTAAGLQKLKPVFQEDGCITAGNASGIVDGAAAILVGSEKAASEHGLRPRARVVATAAAGSDPHIMLTGPISASTMVLEKARLNKEDIDIWEINEAFACVPLVVMRELELDHEKVNVNGGAIALGHPLGATGAMLLGTALDELERNEGRYALVTMCIGLGMATATIIERII